MIAASSGGLGDIVYAIPIMKTLGIKTLYVKESYYFPPYGNLYLSCKRLVEQQGIKVLPTSGAYHPHQYEPNLKFDIDLDGARYQPLRGRNHIIISYLNHFRLSHDNWRKPWLRVEGSLEIQKKLPEKYCVIHRTNRWRRNSQVNWRMIVDKIDHPLYFIGFEYERQDFCKEIAKEIPHLPTEDILEMAILIRDSQALYSNQSVSLTIAQGLGKDYYLDRNVPKTNCLMHTSNEHLLN